MKDENEDGEEEASRPDIERKEAKEKVVVKQVGPYLCMDDGAVPVDSAGMGVGFALGETSTWVDSYGCCVTSPMARLSTLLHPPSHTPYSPVSRSPSQIHRDGAGEGRKSPSPKQTISHG
ncbi:hypothetical protein H109_01833 [Trichophyton interdigitale MR816]|uniref:Uncharacterized protein n=1 Tax=Trichophyton interdigitale (strain MR816) TaxID=1215338 RepID=A0A059JES8_TRIIM|nr:hypothetical protein H109_01833 [Trichophyton interdigitale MR816]